LVVRLGFSVELLCLVLCAFGDASTALRYEASVTVISKLSDLSTDRIFDICRGLLSKASGVLEEQGVLRGSQKQFYEADCRFKGQATNLPVDFQLEEVAQYGTNVLEKKLITFLSF
jgi:N-methylhydantoinase A/oxoprolinase/acetone carboxylase beta subunit